MACSLQLILTYCQRKLFCRLTQIDRHTLSRARTQAQNTDTNEFQVKNLVSQCDFQNKNIWKYKIYSSKRLHIAHQVRTNTLKWIWKEKNKEIICFFCDYGIWSTHILVHCTMIMFVRECGGGGPEQQYRLCTYIFTKHLAKSSCKYSRTKNARDRSGKVKSNSYTSNGIGNIRFCFW